MAVKRKLVTQKQKQELIDLLSDGVARYAACGQLGFSSAHLRTKMREDPEFERAVRDAEMVPRDMAMNALYVLKNHANPFASIGAANAYLNQRIRTEELQRRRLADKDKRELKKVVQTSWARIMPKMLDVIEKYVTDPREKELLAEDLDRLASQLEDATAEEAYGKLTGPTLRNPNGRTGSTE